MGDASLNSDFVGVPFGIYHPDATLGPHVQNGTCRPSVVLGLSSGISPPVLMRMYHLTKMRTGPIDDLSAANLERIVTEHVAEGSTVSTDEFTSYGKLATLGFEHGVVNHSAEEWVRGIHHTNTLEGHWSLFKRAVRGTHVSISTKHAWKYVGEFTYRRNFRHSHRAMFDRLVGAFSLPRLAET
jgi:transposase-like protein